MREPSSIGHLSGLPKVLSISSTSAFFCSSGVPLSWSRIVLRSRRITTGSSESARASAVRLLVCLLIVFGFLRRFAHPERYGQLEFGLTSIRTRVFQRSDRGVSHFSDIPSDLKFLSVLEFSDFVRVIESDCVVGHLFVENLLNIDIRMESSQVIQNPDDCVDKFNWSHWKVWKFVIHEGFPFSFESL